MTDWLGIFWLALAPDYLLDLPLLLFLEHAPQALQILVLATPFALAINRRWWRQQSRAVRLRALADIQHVPDEHSLGLVRWGRAPAPPVTAQLPALIAQVPAAWWKALAENDP